MAKKPTAPEEAATPKEAAPVEAGAKEAALKEKKPREPKEAKEAKAKTAPAVPGDGRTATKKKGKRPGLGAPRGKKLRNLIKQQQQKLAKEGAVPVKRAIGFLKSMKRAKFDETVEVHMSLGIDTTQSDQLVRGAVSLPHGIGKARRVVIFCQGDNVAKAKEAGADYAGGQDLVDKIQKENWLDFDVALATQDMMGMASRLGKLLGPRGLMPTPKAGTVIPASADVAAAVREFKAGKVEYRADKGGNVHGRVGKLSFDDDKLAANITAFVEQIRSVKPAGVKGNYVKTITLSATQSPGVSVSM